MKATDEEIMAEAISRMPRSVEAIFHFSDTDLFTYGFEEGAKWALSQMDKDATESKDCTNMKKEVATLRDWYLIKMAEMVRTNTQWLRQRDYNDFIEQLNAIIK